MNIKSEIVLSIFALSFLSSTVIASGYSCESGEKSQWMSKTEVIEFVVQQGYEVRKVEVENGCYEVYAKKDGKRFELFVNPLTGSIEKTKQK